MTLPSRATHRPDAGRRTLVLAALLALAAAGCERERKPVGPPPADVLVARDLAAALFDAERLGEAETALAPLIERDPVDPDDLVAMAIVQSAKAGTRAEFEAVERLLARALELAPDHAAAHFVRGQLHLHWGQDPELALTSLRRADALAAGDPATRLALAAALRDRYLSDDDEVARREAASVLRSIVDRGIEHAGSWYLTALYMLSDLADGEERAELLAEHARLRGRGLPEPTSTDLKQGTLGRLRPPAPISADAPRLAPPRLGETLAIEGTEAIGSPRTIDAATRIAAWRALTAADLEQPAPEGFDPEVYVAGGDIGASGLLVGDGERAFWIEPGAAGAPWRARVALESPHAALAAVDLDPDWEGRTRTDPGVSTAELVVLGPDGALAAWRAAADGAYARLGEPLSVVAGARAFVAVDLDHEGDLDLVAAGALAEGRGATYLRADDGTSGQFARLDDVLSVAGERAWILAEDFDNDGDTDLLAGGGAASLTWLDSERQDRFVDRSEHLGGDVDGSRAPLAADFDGDGFVDLWFPASGERLMGRFGERFERTAPPPATRALVPPAASTPVLVDVDLDTAADVLWIDDAGRLTGLLALGQGHERVFGPLELGARPGPLAVTDVDGDGALEVVFTRADGALAARRLVGGEGRGVRVALRGLKDNARGVGATVEVRAGALYRRLRWDGEPRLIGLGRAAAADVIRVTWPNGVVQTLLDARAGEERVVEQIEGLIGSCPFLYTWNGETFEFVTDVLGITPLGLPMAPGMLVPPDHDEYVLIRGEQLAPKDGAYVVQITEELREVTYLDEVRLHVVDHPIGTELFPNERFTFPPFPAHELHLVRDPLAPLAAIDQDGRDWSAELAHEDGELAIPFRAERGQFLGLASPHSLELAFDAAAVRDAPRLRLVMCGWFYWTDASVNMAAAAHPEREFVPPILEVPDGAGGWRAVGPPIGFPAGKLKTMVLDVGDVLVREDPRIRLSSTLRLYWDAIRLATCDGTHERREVVLAPSAATLWERGFSATVWLHEEERLEWFDWDRLAAEPRWNQHPGRYTRHGDVLPLVEALDERFVIFGAGDALELAFDARDLLPPPEGWRRDFLLFLDGWAKDRDPNTHEALYVEPLPFHGMSAYPYGDDEAYPDTPATRAYLREWNTRAAKSWLAPLAPHAASSSR